MPDTSPDNHHILLEKRITRIETIFLVVAIVLNN